MVDTRSFFRSFLFSSLRTAQHTYVQRLRLDLLTSSASNLEFYSKTCYNTRCYFQFVRYFERMLEILTKTCVEVHGIVVCFDFPSVASFVC